MLAALCAGFAETTSPPDVCLQNSMETNECLLPGNAGCWSLFVPAAKTRNNLGKNFTACIDTFRGYRCECPSGFTGYALRVSQIRGTQRFTSNAGDCSDRLR